MTAARAVVRIIGLASTLVLARLLAPADFGLVSMATAVAAGLELLTLFGFDAALVQRKEISRDHYDSAWTLNVILGVALALALVSLATPVAQFYREPRLEGVMYLLAAKYAIEYSANSGVVDFRRNIDFRPEFKLQVVPKLAGVMVTIPLAFWMLDYRALLAGMLASAVTAWSMSYLMHPHRPRWCLTEAGSLYRFSRWLLLNNLMTFLRNRSSDFIIGRAIGAGGLGTYAAAFEISNLPSSEMVAPVNRVLFPSYVQLAEDPERLRSAFRATLALIALIILPASIGLAAVADPLVRVMLGTKWLAAIPLVPLLAFAGACTVLQTNTGSLHGALGQPKFILMTGAAHVAALLPMLLFATHEYGIKGTAWALLLHALLIGLPTTYLIVFRTTPIRSSDVLSACWRPVVSCGFMYLVVCGALTKFDVKASTLHAMAALLLSGVVGGAIYVVTVTALWLVAGRPEGAETYLIRKSGRLSTFLGLGRP